MSFDDEDIINNSDAEHIEDGMDEGVASNGNYHPEQFKEEHLTGMYRAWFLDYASYVILERAVPHIDDGLKPVQRRILHSMRRLEDGRYNKVANIIGHTMQFHPHGDRSIGDALVQLGQKGFLIDTQGNWGNIFTGDGAAAPRYIEARLSKMALEVLYSPKVTQWKPSYDGRNKEPITFPVKFSLLLVQGVEGIAVGLSSKILPHNFNEVVDAAIAHLKGEPFTLFPDFQTGGYVDVSRYNDGRRGGAVKVRAKISKIDNKTLCIHELPFGRDTSTLIETIIKANDKGKIKIKKVDDNTADKVEILVHLIPGTSSDKTIDALYAFTDCEMSISPNCCVIRENEPRFLGVSDVLKYNTERTVEVLKAELEIRKRELEEAWQSLSLEKIFIEERIYKQAGYENAGNRQEAITFIYQCLEPWRPKLIRDVTDEDIIKLFEIKMGRILKFNAEKAKEQLLAIEEEIKLVNHHIEHIITFTIDWFINIKNKYGAAFPRSTEIRSFENIEASKVVVANEKLYVNREEGFIGTSLKKDEFIANCSDIDDVILFFKDGRYMITKVSDKQFVGKDIIHIAIFKKNDKRTIYNVVYRDGRAGNYYMKRFPVIGITRDKEYNLTKGTANSRVMYFSANPNGEAEVLRIVLKPKPRLRSLVFEMDFSEMAIKGRNSLGNTLTKNDIHKITLKEKGVSTLGGRDIWFDHDVLRLNTEKRGEYLGEFEGEDRILVVTKKGDYYLTTFDLENHYSDDIWRIEKFEPEKVWTVALFDAEQGYPYIKRFRFETTKNRQSFIGDHANSYTLLVTDTPYPRFIVNLGGRDADRVPIEINVEEFIAEKGVKAKGKRITQFEVANVIEGEPYEIVETDKPDEPDETDLQMPNDTPKMDSDNQFKLF